jgi:hypothetical protein
MVMELTLQGTINVPALELLHPGPFIVLSCALVEIKRIVNIQTVAKNFFMR